MKQKRDRDRDSQPRPRPWLNSQPQGATKNQLEVLGSVFGRADVLWIFIFEQPDFFADFVAGYFSFFGEKGAEKSSRKIPGKILQNL